jgi:hypothetical protein
MLSVCLRESAPGIVPAARARWTILQGREVGPAARVLTQAGTHECGVKQNAT